MNLRSQLSSYLSTSIRFYITFIIEMLFPVLLRERPQW